MSMGASGLRNGLASVLGLLVPLAVYLGATPILLHDLGAAQFGVLVLFVAAVLLINSFDFGLATGGVRALGQCRQPEALRRFRAVAAEIWAAMLLLGASIALLVYLLEETLLVLSGLDVHALGGYAPLALPMAIFFGFGAGALATIPRALERFAGLTLIQVLAGSFNWLGAVVLVRMGYDLESVLLWFAAMPGLSCLALAWWANRLVGGLRWLPGWRFPELRHSFSFGLHSFVGQVAAAATYQADKFLVTYFLGMAAAGYYGLASGLAFRFLTLAAALSGFVFPRAVRLSAASDVVGLRQTYLIASRYVLLVSWPVLVVAQLLGTTFLRLWVGSEAVEAAGTVLLVLLVAYFVASLSVVAAQIFSGMGNARIGAVFSVLGGSINLVACLVLVPQWGLTGAAAASLLSMLQVFGFRVLLHRKLALESWPFLGLCLRMAVATLVPFALLRLSVAWVDGWFELFALGFAGWLSFYAVWFGGKLADHGDWNLLRRIGAFIAAKSAFIRG
jgi:O-antigen/teichoic acid export membrane protein